MRKLVSENPIEVLKILLTRLRVQFSYYTLQNFKLHPDFPNMLSLSYILNQIGIENVTLRATYEQMQNELPKPLLAHLYDNGGMYMVVAEADDNKVYFINEQNKLEAQLKEDFLKSWSGVAMLVDNDVNASEENYKVNKIKERFNKLRYPFIISSLLLLFAYSFLYTHENESTFTYLFITTKFIGVIVSSLLLVQLFDKNNLFIKKLCNSNKSKGNDNCSNILDSPGAYILGLSWSEVGFVYFLTLLTYLIWFPSYSSLLIITVLSILAAPFTLYSIYYQWKVVNSWCRLCLYIQAILFSEALISIFFFNKYNLNFNLISFQDVYALLLIVFLIGICLSFLKPVIKGWKNYKESFPAFNKIKLNKEVFNLLLTKGMPVDTTLIEPVQFGNPDGGNVLTIISNPTCNPCIDMHKKLFKILNNKKNLLVKEIFLTEKNKNDPSYLTADFMLKLTKTTNGAKEAIADYYNNYSKEHDIWKKKNYKKEFESIQTSKILDKHIDWCLEKGINSTPHVLFNGYRLPDSYTVEDLEYLID
ncbi:MAG: cysteine peptidase family C39 domain-containing protein [Bacteroidota bacterium]|nr:cysteine peptidase family C39 domain-containing protein [Bacteroidota bacterium]